MFALVTFRSLENHAPDAVGEEVSNFALPLVFAFAISFIFVLLHRQSGAQPWRLLRLAPFVTLAIAGLQVFLYLTLVMG